MEHTDVHRIVRNELEQSNTSYISGGHAKSALDYYNGVEREKNDRALRDKDGNVRVSVVNSGVISDVVNGVIDQAWPTLQADMLCEFEAMNPEDEGQAENESLAVHHMVMQRNKGKIELSNALHDALLLRYGVMRVWVDSKLETAVREYPELGMAELAMLMQQAQMSEGTDNELEVLSVEPVGEGVIIDPQTQQPVMDETGMPATQPIHAVTVKEWTRKPQFRVEAWPNEQFRVKASTRDTTLQDCDFCAAEWRMSRSAAIARGFPQDVVMAAPSTGKSASSEANISRDRGAVETWNDSNEKMLQEISLWECYVRLDADEDGQAELLNVWLCGPQGDKYVSHERASYIPYACGIAKQYPHRFAGESIYDSHKHIHDSMRGILRGYNDSISQGVNGGESIDVRHIENLDELGVASTDRQLFVRGEPNVIAKDPYNDLSGPCLAALDYWQGLSAQRGGGGVDMAREAHPRGNVGDRGLERLQSTKELPLERMIGVFMDTCVRDLYLLVHHVLRTEWTGSIEIRKDTGEWITEDPSRWGPRENLELRTGMTTGQRLRKSAALEQAIQTMMALRQDPGLAWMVPANRLRNAVIDRDQNNGIVGASKYYVDPNSEEGQGIQQQQAQQQQEMAAKQEQLEQVQMQLQASLAEAEMLKARVAEQKALLGAVGESVQQRHEDERLNLDRQKLALDAADKGVPISVVEQGGEDLAE